LNLSGLVGYDRWSIDEIAWKESINERMTFAWTKRREKAREQFHWEQGAGKGTEDWQGSAGPILNIREGHCCSETINARSVVDAKHLKRPRVDFELCSLSVDRIWCKGSVAPEIKNSKCR
jgi:hypothetical protein